MDLDGNNFCRFQLVKILLRWNAETEVKKKPAGYQLIYLLVVVDYWISVFTTALYIFCLLLLYVYISYNIIIT